MTDIATPPIAAELETLAKDCEECAEGSEAESKYDDRRAWQSVAYRIRHAISRLAIPPLPDEIAEIIKGIDAIETDDPRCGAALENASEALRALAQENGRLKAVVAQIQPPNDIGDDCTAELAVKCASLEQRIRELEAERDEALQLTESCSSLKDMAAACIEGAMWKDRCDAIRCKTIEECAAIAEACGDTLTAEELAVEIRALAHSESEGKEESKE